MYSFVIIVPFVMSAKALLQRLSRGVSLVAQGIKNLPVNAGDKGSIPDP